MVSKGDLEVSSGSIIGLLMLAAAQGTEINLKATGEDAEKAMSAICQLVEDGFYED